MKKNNPASLGESFQEHVSLNWWEYNPKCEAAVKFHMRLKAMYLMSLCGPLLSFGPLMKQNLKGEIKKANDKHQDQS